MSLCLSVRGAGCQRILDFSIIFLSNWEFGPIGGWRRSCCGCCRLALSRRRRIGRFDPGLPPRDAGLQIPCPEVGATTIRISTRRGHREARLPRAAWQAERERAVRMGLPGNDLGPEAKGGAEFAMFHVSRRKPSPSAAVARKPPPQ